LCKIDAIERKKSSHMDMQAIAQIPNNTPKAFIYNALGWQHFEKNRSSSTLDKLKAVAMTIFSILTLGAPILFLKWRQFRYLEQKAKGEKQIDQISKMQDKDAKIKKSIDYLEQFLRYQHNGLAFKTFDLVLLELEKNLNKEAILKKCANLFHKYNQKELLKKAGNQSKYPLFLDFIELNVQEGNRHLTSEIL